MSGSSLTDCLLLASTHWNHNKSMVSQARKCVRYLGANLDARSLGPSDAVELLDWLRGSGVSKSTVGHAYRVFRLMLSLNGISTEGWPKAQTPPRVKAREPMKGEDLERLIGWLDQAGYLPTADLARLLRGTGLRCSVEGLSERALRFVDGPTYGVLTVVGKGGHERVIPVVDAQAQAVLREEPRMARMVQVPYHSHRRYWAKGVAALNIGSKLPTPHSVRHYYATEALERTGGNLVMVMELMGHANPKTTAGYISVDLEAKARALSGEPLRATLKEPS